ncbi:MAG: outer membrane protein, partial [Flavobacteriales bacterium]
MKKSILFLLIVFSSNAVLSQEFWDLRKCINHAIENNINIQSQLLTNELNTENAKQTNYNALPNLNSNVSHGYNWGQRIDPFTNQFASERVRNNNLNVSTNVVLFNGLRIGKLKEQAKLAVTAGEFDLGETANDISVAVSQSFLSNLLSKEQLKIAQGQRDITLQQIDRMTKLVNGGQEPKANLYELEAQLATDDLGIVRIENDILLSRVSLINLLQLKGAESESFDIVAPDNLSDDIVIPAVSANELYQSAIANQPEIQAAMIREDQTTIDIDVAKSDGLPSLSLFGSIGSGYSGANSEGVGETNSAFIPVGQVGIGGETVFTLQEQESFSDFQTRSFGDQLDQNFNQSLGFNLSIPIFNGFASKTNVSRAKINLELARLNTERVKNTLANETQQAYANAIAALNQYKSTEKSVEVFERNFDNAQKRFENGLINSTEFNAAKTQMQNQQFQMISSKYEYIFRMKIM